MKDGAPLGEQFVFPLLIVSREFELNQVGAGFNLPRPSRSVLG
jgi:hypothetical protein